MSTFCACPGSPPLAREQQCVVRILGRGDGITPARAGTTPRVYTQRHQVRDHPRSRGNNALIASIAFLPTGITPARAGTTLLHMPYPDHRRDHPRSRGNNQRPRSVQPTHIGSPPLAREQPMSSSADSRSYGITPARAGTTSIRWFEPIKGWDHPRSRGNNSLRVATQSHTTGSPPLAREQPFNQIRFLISFGITPARAGTTHIGRGCADGLEDHPRSRGNNDESSNVPVIGCRITPARAGTTFSRTHQSNTARDHPRSRRNNIGKLYPICTGEGSPPLAREQPSSRFVVRASPGITPARAGTTD